MIVSIGLIDNNFIMDDFGVLSIYEHYILILFCRFLLGREIKLQLYKDLRYSNRLMNGTEIYCKR